MPEPTDSSPAATPADPWVRGRADDPTEAVPYSGDPDSGLAPGAGADPGADPDAGLDGGPGTYAPGPGSGDDAVDPGPTRPSLLPRTALGLAVLLLFTSLGAAFSGAIFFALYEFRQNQSDQLLEDIGGEDGRFFEQFENALGTIEEKTNESVERIDAALEPLQQQNLTSERLTELLDQIDESVFFVNTLDEAGQASVGTAFVVFSDSQTSFLITSYAVVQAATREPGPPIRVRNSAGEETQASIQSVDPGRDLALLTLAQGGLPRIEWAEDPPRIGERVFAASGLGSLGAQLAAGTVTDVSGSGIQHDAPVGSAFRGGPLLDGDLQVVGVASRAYAPLNFDPDGLFFAPLIEDICQQVATCP